MHNSIMDRPVAVIMIHLMVGALALFSLSHLPVELSPEVDFPRLNIVTDWPDASSEMVVRSVTVPIEEVAWSVDGVKNVNSISSAGQSVVSIEFDKDVDLDFARIELVERLSGLKNEFPDGVGIPTITKFVPEEFASLQGFMSYNLYGNLSLMEIQKYAEESIKPALMGVKGVSNVRIMGGSEREIYILLDKEKLESAGINVKNIISEVQAGTSAEPLGEISQGGEKNFIYTGFKISSLKDLSQVLIDKKSGVKLGEVARIVDSIATPTSYVRINGKPSTTIEISREQGTNMLSVEKSVEKKVAELSSVLPHSLKLVKILDRTTDMQNEMSELATKSAISAVAILFIVLLFFRNIVISFLIVVSVAFSLSGGLIFLSITGIGVNVLTMAALALSIGIAIDNSIVVVESMVREMEISNSAEGSGKQIKILLHNAVKEIKLPLIAATLTTTGALIPAYFLPENLKPYFIQFAETASIVLLTSILVAFTLVPILVMLTVRARVYQIKSEGGVIRGLKRFYIKVEKSILRHRKIAVLFVIWVIGIPVWLLPDRIELHNNIKKSPSLLQHLAEFYNSAIGSDFYQSIKPYVEYGLGGSTNLFFKHVYKGELWRFGGETYLVVYIEAPQGTPIERIDGFAAQIEGALKPYEKVIKRYTTRVSSGEATVRIDFDPKIAMTSIPFIIKDRMTSLVAQTGGFTVAVSGFGPGYWSGGEVSPSFTIEALGYNYDKVKEIARQVSDLLSRNPRVDNVRIDRLPWVSESYEVVATINRRALQSIGGTVSDFAQEFIPEVASEAGKMYIDIGNKPVLTTIKFSNFQNTSLENIGDKMLNFNSRLVRLGKLVDIAVSPVMPQVERTNQQYVRYITFDFKGPYKFGDVYTDRVVKSLSLPPGYELKREAFFFTFEKEQAVPLILLGLLSVLIVFMVTASLYESYKKPLIVILSVPMSLVGLFSIFYFADANFGRGGYAAVLFLIGLSVNNGILLVDRISREVVQGKPDRFEKEIANAASSRLRPILITTVVTIAGFAPFVINANIYSFWYTFSLGVIGGILVSTPMILLFMPSFYRIASGKGRAKKDIDEPDDPYITS
ncbi:MAG: efflux RND transporter permease subunit [Candidatus Kryptoniota bacterium]